MEVERGVRACHTERIRGSNGLHSRLRAQVGSGTADDDHKTRADGARPRLRNRSPDRRGYKTGKIEESERATWITRDPFSEYWHSSKTSERAGMAGALVAQRTVIDEIL